MFHHDFAPSSSKRHKTSSSTTTTQQQQLPALGFRMPDFDPILDGGGGGKTATIKRISIPKEKKEERSIPFSHFIKKSPLDEPGKCFGCQWQYGKQIPGKGDDRISQGLRSLHNIVCDCSTDTSVKQLHENIHKIHKHYFITKAIENKEPPEEEWPVEMIERHLTVHVCWPAYERLRDILLFRHIAEAAKDNIFREDKKTGEIRVDKESKALFFEAIDRKKTEMQNLVRDKSAKGS